MARVFKPNMSLITAQAAAIKERMSSFGDRQIEWYDWLTEGEDGSDGQNYLRALPPWSELGIIAVVTYKWDLPHTRESFRHLSLTWPERGIEDPIQAVCQRIVADYPFLAQKIKEEVGTRIVAFLNVIDRRHEERGPLACRMPGSVYNWFVSQMELMRQYGIDPTDPEQGIDCAIKRSPNIKGWYEHQFMGTLTPQGFSPTLSPLHADPKVREDWLGHLWNIDKIIHFPDDEYLVKQQECADNLRMHYEIEARRQLATPPAPPAGGMPSPIASQVASMAQGMQAPAPGAYGVGTPGFQGAPQPAPAVPPQTSYLPQAAPPAMSYLQPPPQVAPGAVPGPSAPSMAQIQMPTAVPMQAPMAPAPAPAIVIPPAVPTQSWAPPVAQPAQAPIIAPIAPPPVFQPPPVMPVMAQPGPVIPPTASAMVTAPSMVPRPALIPPVGGAAPAPVAGSPMAQTAAASPMSRPACFQDHQTGLAKCMMCPMEFDCLATIKQIGRRPFAWDPREVPNPER